MVLPNSLAFAPVRVLGEKLRAGEFTSRALTEFSLARLESLGPKYNSVVTVTREAALAQADQADRELKQKIDLGPLHGIPFGVKDLLATKGIRTTWGAAPKRDRMPDFDATVIQRLRRRGAVLCAKLAMVEIAGGMGYQQADASFTGPGLNPWSSKRWSGGSSSGCGSAVAAGLVPFAIGSETWGSILNPSAFCGVTGLRPTYGRVSRHGAMALSWTMDKLGPMCRTADDCGLVLDALAGRDPEDATSLDQPYSYVREALKHPPFRIAALKNAAQGVQPEIRANYENALKTLVGLGTVEETDLPDLPYDEATSLIISCEMAAAFEGMATSGDVWQLTAPEDRWGVFPALAIPARDYINAMRIRGKVQRIMDEITARYDVVVAPTEETVAYPLEGTWRDYRRGFYSAPIGAAANLAGIPGISVPNGFGEAGLPTGLMFVARALEENKLLAVAAAYQQVTDWHTRFPVVET